ncbi:hypothetical protein M5D96_013285 [Drosophila gunungcola]|uniref:Uncharacterized protein n=1 Tax=Drosophila gunungcola TaxID=103775 RepID=A0A9P9YCE3_9MUSC|nr:hypothetical protein M5D96_013285 [Drosophila gunungcola]
MRSYQLTLIFAMGFLWAVASGSTQPPSTTARTLPWNCPLFPEVCSRNSPKVCGRTPRGECQRFENICHLMLAHRLGWPVGVRHTRDLDCRNLRGDGPAHRRPCYEACPPRPVVCKRSPPEPAHLRAQQEQQAAVQGAGQQVPVAQPELPQPAQKQLAPHRQEALWQAAVGRQAAGLPQGAQAQHHHPPHHHPPHHHPPHHHPRTTTRRATTARAV